MQRACAVERIPRPSSMTMLRPAAVTRGTVAVKCCFMPARGLSVSPKCPYRTLGVSHDADIEAIKDAFRRKVKQVHPDASGSPTTAKAFMECQNAYHMLLDPAKRATYDKTLLPRAKSQVLSYLNARSAARHGIPVPRGPSRATCNDSPELYSTMLKLLYQVKTCAKNLEREIVGKDRGHVQDPAPSSRPHTSGARSAGIVASEADCGDGECCEPWLFYASQSVNVDPITAMRRR